MRLAEVGRVTVPDDDLLGLTAPAAQAAQAEANGHPAPAPPPAPPAAPKPPAAPNTPRGPRGVPPTAKAEPCGPCEDGLTLGLGKPLPRPAEIALGVLGCTVGIILIGMGLDLVFGGQLGAILGLGGSSGNPGPS